jgi:6-pyruvoyltetrahydropterin/6-carboxytetrahydropterin synthase
VRSPFRLHVVTADDQLYFGHMTVYPGGRKERLHGHNFRVFLDIDLADGSFAAMFDLDVARHALGELCARWKERLLLPAKSEHLELVREDDTEIEVRLCGDRYVLPRRDVVLVPIDNVSVEGLAQHIAELLVTPLAPLRIVTGFEVRIEELPGIGASCYRALQ